MSRQGIENSIKWLLLATFTFALLFPPISIGEGLPKVELGDVSFILLMGLSALFYREELVGFYQRNKFISIVLVAMIVVALISIFLNGTYGFLSNLFEPLKMVRLGCFIFLFYSFFRLEEFMRSIKLIFLALCGLNALHYFDVLSFNTYVEVFYAPQHHLDFFGLNSIGQPAAKRMLGTLGNPNNNSVLFLFMLLFFLPKRNKPIVWDFVFSTLAVSGIVMCQSRTGLLAFLVLFLFYAIFIRPRWKIILLLSFMSCAVYALNYFAGNAYMSTVGDMEVLARVKEGRMYQWRRIIQSVEGKWLFGRGVDKEYMRANEIYGESEYFLGLFRYGLMGLFAQLILYAYLFFSYLKKSISNMKILLPGAVIIFVVTGITNTPLQSPKLSILFALAVGVGLRSLYEPKEI